MVRKFQKSNAFFAISALEAHNFKKETFRTNFKILNIEFGIRNERASLFCLTSINYESIPIASYINKWRFTFKIYDHIMVSDTKTMSLALKGRSERLCGRNKLIVKFYEKCLLCSTGYSILVSEDICRMFYYMWKYCFYCLLLILCDSDYFRFY